MSAPPAGKLALPELAAMKARGEKIVMVTAYDMPGARFAEDAGIDLVLVGDTAAMVVLGHEGTTVPVTMDEMIFLTRAVARATRRPIVIGDLPFGTYQVSDEDAVLCTDALATGYFGAQLADIEQGDVVAVFGAGPVGLYAAASAWLMGAGRVIVVDHLDYRLEKARTFAHAETRNFAELDDVVVEMKKTTGWLGADRVIDAVGAEADGNLRQQVSGTKLKLQGGSPVALNWAIDRVRKGGTVSVMGAYGPIFSAVKFGDALNKGLTLRGAQQHGHRYVPEILERMSRGEVRTEHLATHVMPLEDGSKGYEMFKTKADGCVRAVFRPSA